ncbi:hypothetical protein [Dyadobacter sp. CY323]|uniref:hypothetical protein n=1 Tax=Dyadobacter sp. CY323 TaxID=2907302 RepID=UPI001F426AB9|nr:hypothetical protein [Dyadobacter sp. CY323]MCE6992908.1 hypothetical protein [Dyadobacter sp. CY323]
MIHKSLVCLLVLTFLNAGIVHSQLPEPEISSTEITTGDSIPVIRVYFNKYFVGRQKLRIREVADLISCVDSSNFVMFNKGHKLQKVGGTVAILGGGLALVGSLVAMGEALNNLFSQTSDNGSTGVPVLIASCGVTFTGLLLMTVGKSQKTKSVRLYNRTAKAGEYTLSAGIYGNSLSVRLKF